MAAKYKHKKRGYQVRYTIYFPDGTSKVKFKYSKTSVHADEILRKCEFFQRGSRRGDLNKREIVDAIHARLITDEEAKLLSGARSLDEYRIKKLLEGYLGDSDAAEDAMIAIGHGPSVAYDLDKVMANYELTSSVANTPYNHKVNIRRALQLKKWFEKHPIPKLTDEDVKRYVCERRIGKLTYFHRFQKRSKRGVSDKTIKTELMIMQQIIDEAVKLKMVRKNVARLVKVTVKNKRFRRTCTAEEVRKILTAARENSHSCFGMMYEIAMTSFYTGLRRMELRTLTVGDLDFDHRFIKVQGKAIEGENDFTTKTGNISIKVMPDKLYNALAEYVKIIKGPYLFPDSRGRPIPAGTISKTFKKVILLAGVDPALSLHHARHTFASNLIKLAKGDLNYAKERLSHKDLESTKGYLHVIGFEDAPERVLDYGE